jgi:hypothetical protein
VGYAPRCGVDVACAHSFGDVALPRHLSCAGCELWMWVDVAAGDGGDDVRRR